MADLLHDFTSNHGTDNEMEEEEICDLNELKLLVLQAINEADQKQDWFSTVKTFYESFKGLDLPSYLSELDKLLPVTPNKVRYASSDALLNEAARSLNFPNIKLRSDRLLRRLKYCLRDRKFGGRETYSNAKRLEKPNSIPSKVHYENVAKMLDTVSRPMLECLSHPGSRISPEFDSLLTRFVYYASARTICSDERFHSGRCLERLFECLVPERQPGGDLFISKFCAVMNHLSARGTLGIFVKTELIYKFRFVAYSFTGPTFSHLTPLKKCYERLEVDDILTKRVPCWNMLLRSRESLKSNNFPHAMEALSRAIEHESFSHVPLINSGIIKHIESFLTRMDSINNGALETFLQAILKFSHSVFEVEKVPKGSTFEKLVKHLIATLDYLLYKDRTPLETMSVKVIVQVVEILEDNVLSILNSLNCLYILNRTWYQWFDIASAGPIVDDRIFSSHQFKDPITAKDCPALYPLAERIAIFRKYLKDTISSSLSNRRFDRHEVSRNNAIKSFINLFESRSLDARWSLYFSNENGRGPGPTREAYSVVSQELQKHEMDMWQHESLVESKSDKTMYVHSSVGLFPKTSGSASIDRKFVFLGTLMAKSLLDDHCLSIPLSDEFFRRLMGNRFSHLRKDYYDIQTTFPVAKGLIKDLIRIKRLKKIIQFNCHLSENEKNEKIGSLTFENGCSFEDLYMNFTVPGTNEELLKGGSDLMLTPYNLEMYLEALSFKKSQMDPVYQFEAIRTGFSWIFELKELDLFYPEELRTFYCDIQVEEWTMDYVERNCSLVSERTKSFESFKYLFQIMCSFSNEEKKLFLRFVTGSTCLRTGGLATLKPKLTLYERKGQGLPYVSVCRNALYLPNYESLEITKEKLMFAMTECHTFEEL